MGEATTPAESLRTIGGHYFEPHMIMAASLVCHMLIASAVPQIASRT